MRELILWIKSGCEVPDFVATREVRDEDAAREYAILRTLPNITSIIVAQKPGEPWLDYLRVVDELQRGTT